MTLAEIKPREETLPASPRGLPVPWWAKIGAKMVLSRLVPSYRARKALGLFLHGNLDQNVVRHRAFVANVLTQHEVYAGRAAAVLLELGPGNTLGAALFAAARGVTRIWLSDVGDFAGSDMEFYRRLAAMIEVEQPGFSNRVDFSDRSAMLASLNATYLTAGTESLCEVPSDSLDVILSTAVLEHVRRSEFAMLGAEMMRMLRPGGTSYHEVDLMDHLGGAQNNLRFSEGLWESPLMANSGFYTNRMRCCEILQIMRAAGFDVALARVARWPVPPTPRNALAQDFNTFAEAEMRIANFAMWLRKPA
jgi:hypothetical protein